MSFLYPALATAALAVLVPIILHLFRRRDLRRIEFPAVRYLRRAEERHAQRLKIRHVLLLLTRVTMVLLLAILAAGLLAGRGGPGDHEPTAIAIVIDNSLSASRPVEDRSLLEGYIDRVEATLDWIGPQDRLAIFDSGDPEALPFSGGDIAAARDYVRSLRPSAAPADLTGSLTRASSWLESHPDMPREVHLLTDLQAISLSRQPPEAVGATDGSDPRFNDGPALATGSSRGFGIAALVHTPSIGSQPNGTLGPPLPESDPPHAGLPTRIATQLTWFGSEPPTDPVVVRLVIDDRVVAAAEARMGETALLTLPPQGSGYLQGRLEMDGQGMSADDRRYFTWLVRQPPRVGVATDPGDFLGHALSTLEDAGRLLRVAPSRADALIAPAGGGSGTAPLGDRNVILLPPEDPLDLPRFNLRLAGMGVAWRLEPTRGVGSSRISEAPDFPAIVGLRIHRAYRLTAAGLDDAQGGLARLEDGRTWLVGGTTRAGSRYLLTASPLTPEASELPVSVAMVPFLDALIADALGPGRGGATLNREGTARVRVPERARGVVRPDGAATPVEGGAWLEAGEPGNYSFTGLDAGAELGAFSINPPLAESDLTAGRFEDLTGTLPAADWTRVEGGSVEEWVDAAFVTRRGRHVWWPLVVALVLASIVEASLAAAGRRGTTGVGVAGRLAAASGGSEQAEEW